ncbi:MAG: Asp-tRNA(Asn)/Glu-tRNA(Gln) amidotransferase subunit GatC [Epsilonproteobacteria bacterium]|nr:Asp-tRNA(Asn)/Glu-tRNA(Gln) amidotransferase subunit GatC [Campylobacterota bacterium]
MVTIDDLLLERLENLSLLRVEKRDAIEADLNRFLEFVEVLNELDLDGVEALFSPTVSGAPLRDDEPQNDPSIAQELLSHAPRAVDNFFIVPKIID